MFVNELTNTLENAKMTNISSIKLLENTVQEYLRIIKSIWYKFSKNVNITKCSNIWWNNKCCVKLNTYHSSKSLEDWKTFKRVVKNTKYTLFDNKI